MLEYIKYILEKMSFDPHLFEKELMKNIRDLVNEELAELKKWCYEKFGNVHTTILERCFAL